LVAEPAVPIRDMGADLAQLAFEAKLPFLDARRSGEYAEGHIAGAWCLPVWESDLDARITLFEARVRSDSRDPLVIYCGGGDCEDSRILASKLMGLGYRNLWVYHGGYPEWTQAGRPVRKGDQP
jgi:rhodanese-related sulfurtransferase